MSSVIWTLDELRSECIQWYGEAWRFVEAQHVISTNKLVTRQKQPLLEIILDETKPTIPTECTNLDFLLFTPFRYRPDHGGSRFRKVGQTEGVWYGSEFEESALAEMVFYRFLAFAESPDTQFPAHPHDFTSYSVKLSTSKLLDLTIGKLSQNSDCWQNPSDYSNCQSLADKARKVGVQIIRYKSVRDKKRRPNLAVLSCKAFESIKLLDQHTWKLKLEQNIVTAICDSPKNKIIFKRDEFTDDPRLN